MKTLENNIITNLTKLKIQSSLVMRDRSSHFKDLYSILSLIILYKLYMYYYYIFIHTIYIYIVIYKYVTFNVTIYNEVTHSAVK